MYQTAICEAFGSLLKYPFFRCFVVILTAFLLFLLHDFKASWVNDQGMTSDIQLSNHISINCISKLRHYAVLCISDFCKVCRVTSRYFLSQRFNFLIIIAMFSRV